MNLGSTVYHCVNVGMCHIFLSLSLLICAAQLHCVHSVFRTRPDMQSVPHKCEALSSLLRSEKTGTAFYHCLQPDSPQLTGRKQTQEQPRFPWGSNNSCISSSDRLAWGERTGHSVAPRVVSTLGSRLRSLPDMAPGWPLPAPACSALPFFCLALSV